MADYSSQLNNIMATSETYEQDWVVYEEMKDQHTEVTINEKVVNISKIGTIVKGECNSQMITFSMNRYYDGVDLYGKQITFLYKNVADTNVCVDYASNIETALSKIKFSWVFSQNVTAKAGTVLAAIQFIGISETGEPYSLKTTPFAINVEDSLQGTDQEVTVSDDWFTRIETRIKNIERYATTETGEIDYASLGNLPSINGVQMTGNKTLNELNIAAKEHIHSQYTTTTAVKDIMDEKINDYIKVGGETQEDTILFIDEDDEESVDLPELVNAKIDEKLPDVIDSRVNELLVENVDTVLYDHTDLTISNSVANNMLVPDYVVEKGLSVKSVNVSARSGISGTIKVSILAKTDDTFSVIKTFEYIADGSNTIYEIPINYVADVDCYIGLDTDTRYLVCFTQEKKETVYQCGTVEEDNTYTIDYKSKSFVVCAKCIASHENKVVYSDEIKRVAKNSSRTIVVAQDGTGDYTTISEAVEKSNTDKNIIYIKNGIYEEEVNAQKSYPIYLIGEDRDLTILQNSLAGYNHCPLYHSFGGVKNMTIISLDDGTTTPNNYSEEPHGTWGSYAIHADHPNTNAVGSEYIVDNCTLISYWNAGIGIGTIDKQTITLRNCQIESYCNYEGGNNTGLVNGALIAHNHAGVSYDGQCLNVENTTLYSKYGSRVLRFSDFMDETSSFKIKFKNVSIFNENSGSNGDDAIYVTSNKGTGDGWKDTMNMTLDGLSFGNSAPCLNYA